MHASLKLQQQDQIVQQGLQGLVLPFIFLRCAIITSTCYFFISDNL